MSIKFLVPEPVVKYIEQHKLYYQDRADTIRRMSEVDTARVDDTRVDTTVDAADAKR